MEYINKNKNKEIINSNHIMIIKLKNKLNIFIKGNIRINRPNYLIIFIYK